MKDGQAMVVDLSEAPQHIREEIESLKGRVHNMDALDSLSKETKDWMINQAKTHREELGILMKRSYLKMIHEIEIMTLGIHMLHMVVGEDDAKGMNRDLHNACAQFVRDYNESIM